MRVSRQDFTLIELVAVVVIAALGLGLAVTAFRSGSQSVAFENTVQEFTRFCARSRVRAMTLGRDQVISYDSETRTFRSDAPTVTLPDENAVMILEWPEDGDLNPPPEDTEKMVKLTWKLPENYTMELPENNNPDASIDLFRFFPNGGGTGVRSFTLEYRALKKTLEISPLTGVVQPTEETTP